VLNHDPKPSFINMVTRLAGAAATGTRRHSVASQLAKASSSAEGACTHGGHRPGLHHAISSQGSSAWRCIFTCALAAHRSQRRRAMLCSVHSTSAHCCRCGHMGHFAKNCSVLPDMKPRKPAAARAQQRLPAKRPRSPQPGRSGGADPPEAKRRDSKPRRSGGTGVPAAKRGDSKPRRSGGSGGGHMRHGGSGNSKPSSSSKSKLGDSRSKPGSSNSTAKERCSS
jgi:hypothetical protein